MIGVVAEASSLVTISEFFELFKTPWEPYRSPREYDVILCIDGLECKTASAKLVILYSSRKLSSDNRLGITVHQSCNGLLQHGPDELPIYGGCCAFQSGSGAGQPTRTESGQSIIWQQNSGRESIVRIGYDLVDEIRHLLTAGQPAKHAQTPTLELHIDILRQLIISAGIELIEIPPVPLGYQSITCLTHDIDHPSIRRHRWDHTSAGFLYRAIVDSVKDYLSGAIPFRDLRSNWAAASRLVFVHLGLARDFWLDFPERYRQIENDAPSTWFVVPFGGYAGRAAQGDAPDYRATRYGAADIAGAIEDLLANSCEVGLHGLDAWIDEGSGRRELEEIRSITGVSEIGTRMHWLFFDQGSPAVLERAGASYDSTVGYREAVGFRAGTAQAYRPKGADKLLELPLLAMDTALFYPAYLGLSQSRATALLKGLAGQVDRFGGCLTINWHDRSLVPERQWYMSYCELLGDLKGRRTWFATASEAVSWFRKRRAYRFDCESDAASQTESAKKYNDGLPGLQIRSYNRLSNRKPESLASLC